MSYRHSEPVTPSKPMREKWGILALILITCSQLLYLLSFFAWLFQWIRSTSIPAIPLKILQSSSACRFRPQRFALRSSRQVPSVSSRL